MKRRKEEASEEEVVEDMDFDAQLSRFQGSFRPTRYCRHFFAGQCWMGSSHTHTTSFFQTLGADGDFQQSKRYVLKVPSVLLQIVGHSSCGAERGAHSA